MKEKLVEKCPKILYRELCANEDLIPLFSKDWWLDSVVGADKWDVALVFKDGKIIASMPYIIKKIVMSQIFY